MQIATFSKRRLFTWLAVMMVCCFGALGVWAQNASQPLTTGQAVSGALDAQNVAHVYTLTAKAGDRVSVIAQSDAPLALMLTDTNGAVLSQSSGQQGASLSNITVSAAGTYFATVFAAPGSSAATSSFTITLFIGDVPPDLLGATATTEAPVVTEAPAGATSEPAATQEASTTGFPAPTDVLISSGMEVRLTWNADVDLNLNVRDPLGNQLFWNSSTTPIGGRFGFDANGLCQIISDAPAETATWTPGFLPDGSYEVLVFYKQSCVTPPQPVTFTLQITVNGVKLDPVTSTLTPPPDATQNSVYVTSFKINPDATARIGAGGVYPDTSLNILPAAANDVLNSAKPITVDTPVHGALFGGQFYQTYNFDATANQIVTINLARTSGSLDTLLQVVDANGNLVDVNDDVDLTTTNSALTNLRLLRAGRYTIVATRYGKDLGGSEGEYDLTLSGPTGALPAEVSTLGLPEGAIQISLTWNSAADIQLLVRDPVGDSVFDDKPQINSGGILAANGNVNCVRSTNPTPVSYIYWPNGFLRPGTYEVDVWYQNTCNDTTPVDFNLTALVNGEVVISDRQHPSIGQHYVVSFTINADGTATRREGGIVTDAPDAPPTFDYTTATVLPVVLNVPLTGEITADDFFQVYGFNGTAGQQISVAMSSTTPALDTKLFLISPTGLVAAQNDDAQPGTVKNSLINKVTLKETGQYRIVATRYAMQFGGTVGQYTLQVTP